MRTKAITNTILSLALVATTRIALADTKHAHPTSHTGHDQSMHATEHAGAEAGGQSVENTLQAIHGKQNELAEVVSNKKLDAVHHLAFAIRDLAKPLTEKVSPDKRSKVEGTVNNIAKLADELDASGDAGDQLKTEANLKKLDGTLKLLEAQVAAK